VKNKLNIIAFALAAVVFASATACQKADGGNTNANKAAGNTAVVTNTAAASPTPASADTATSSADTPIGAYKAAYAARKNKDVPALKKLMSKDIMEFFSEISGIGEKKQTVYELLMDLCEKPQAPTAEARNEKINGDKATIEYLDEKGGWSPMEFVKEDGSWKLTIERPEKGDVDIETGPKGNKDAKGTKDHK